uniref:Nitroreductase family protein n=1 Tax=Prevotella sp. GTC17260 TaxID=3236796 RepID=A0AB33J5I8_9BACT
MSRNFIDAIVHRRSYYALKNESPISDEAIQSLIERAVLHVPSAFNSQSTRIVVLLGDKHRHLWELTKDALRAIVPADAFAATEAKINTSFESGYGTVLFYEDQKPVKALQEQFPTYAPNFPIWSEHTNAMHQLTIWTALDDAGLAASVQHYNPIIDETVAQAFDIPANWTLRAQMPFGIAAGQPGEKTFQPIEQRVRVLK